MYTLSLKKIHTKFFLEHFQSLFLYIKGHETNNKYNMIISKWIYSYDEKNILPNAHQVKIIGYSLSRLEIKLYFYS